MLENIHPCAYVAKVQTHAMDNPTYKNTLRADDDERKLWDESMIRELKSLAELGSCTSLSTTIHELANISNNFTIAFVYLQHQFLQLGAQV